MTPLGIIIAVVGLLLAITSRKWLYIGFIISIAFSGTSVLNVGSGLNASGVQVWMYLGALLLMREFGASLLNPLTRVNSSLMKRGMLLLLPFVLALTASLLMPIYINGHSQISSPTLTDSSSEPLYFGIRNVTSILYIYFGSLVAFTVAKNNILNQDARLTERAYLAGAILTSALGVIEFFSHWLHIPSLTLLFRNSASPGAEGFLALLSVGVARVSSVAVEPSILSQYLVSALPLALSSFLGNGYIYSRRIDRFAFCLLLFVLFLTTSSVAYLTLMAAPVLFIPVLFRMGLCKRKLIWRILVGGLTLLTLLAGLYFTSSIVRQILDLALFAKAGSYSALERLRTVTLAWEYFNQYPLLGVGWGSITSHDLVMKILGSAGIFGFGAFCGLIFLTGHSIFRRLNDEADNARGSRAIWLLSGLLLLFASAISEFPYVFGHSWFVLGMGMSASLREYRRFGSVHQKESGNRGNRSSERLDDQWSLPA